MIPILDLKAQYAAIEQEIDAAIKEVLLSSGFILGPVVQELEGPVAAYCECDYGIGVASGTDALRLTLTAMGVGPGDEVITTPFTFIATANTISHCRARPVFVDIDPRTYNIDPAAIEAAITERTKAILPVHLYGQPADMDPVMELAEKYGLYVVEDCAQAIGARYRSRRKTNDKLRTRDSDGDSLVVGRFDRPCWLPELLSQQESGSLWRWGDGGHKRWRGSRTVADAAHPRLAEEVLP